jgi:hypothetical protein
VQHRKYSGCAHHMGMEGYIPTTHGPVFLTACMFLILVCYDIYAGYAGMPNVPVFMGCFGVLW